MKPNDVTKSDHEFVWLEPKNHDHGEEGRIWCQDDVWSSECLGEECGGPTKYVRSDLYDALALKLDAARTALENIRDSSDALSADPTKWPHTKAVRALEALK